MKRGRKENVLARESRKQTTEPNSGSPKQKRNLMGYELAHRELEGEKARKNQMRLAVVSQDKFMQATGMVWLERLSRAVSRACSTC